MFRHGCPCFGSVSSLSHVECHDVRLLLRFLLPSGAERSSRTGDAKAALRRVNRKTTRCAAIGSIHQLVYPQNTTGAIVEPSHFASSLILILLMYKGA